ncbi:MAG: CvpA family protein [Methylocystaceae bacterium]
MQWNWVDLVLALFILMALIGGYRRGLTTIVSGWLGLIMGFLTAVLFFKPVKTQLLGWLGMYQPAAAGGTAAGGVANVVLTALMTVVAFALIMAAVNMLFRFIGKGIHRLMDSIGMAWIDGGLGAIISLIITVVAVSLILGMGKPLLQMGTTAHWDWAIAASQEIERSRLEGVFLQVYERWGDWVNINI